jgi:hypothetical protein
VTKCDIFLDKKREKRLENSNKCRVAPGDNKFGQNVRNPWNIAIPPAALRKELADGSAKSALHRSKFSGFGTNK